MTKAAIKSKMLKTKIICFLWDDLVNTIQLILFNMK
jgi:hypothetical protein